MTGNPIPEDSNTDIWVYDLATENSRQLTFEKGDDDGPVWTSDSSRLYFRALEEGTTGNGAVYSVSADGGSRTLVAKSDDFPFALPWSLSSDGRTLALVSARTLQEVDLAMLDVQGKDAFHLLLKGPQVVSEPVISPNGQWLAYMELTIRGTAEINIRSFPDVSRQRYPMRAGWKSSVLPRRLRTVLLRRQRPVRRVGCVSTHAANRRRAAAVPCSVLDGVAGPNGGLGRAWDVDRRGERFLMIRMPGAAAPGEAQAAPPAVRLNVVLNWLDEVKTRAQAR